MRVLGPGLIGLVGFVVWVYAIFDSIATDSTLVRNLPKIAWIFLVIILGPIGAIAWLAFGRPINAGWAPGDTTTRNRRPVLGLEDTDEWTHSRPPMAPAPPPTPRVDPAPVERPSAEDLAAEERRLMEWEAELRRREDEQRGEGD
jgi:hypothetical protein